MPDLAPLTNTGPVGVILAVLLVGIGWGSWWLLGMVKWALERLLGNNKEGDKKEVGLLPTFISQHKDLVESTKGSNGRQETMQEGMLIELRELRKDHQQAAKEQRELTQLLNNQCGRKDALFERAVESSERLAETSERMAETTKMAVAQCAGHHPAIVSQKESSK